MSRSWQRGRSVRAGGEDMKRWQSLVAGLVIFALGPTTALASSFHPSSSAGLGPRLPTTPDTNYQTAVINDAPIAYWRLGESSGTTAANIGSGANLTGTYSATGVTLGQPGALVGDPGTSIALNGS